MWVGGWGSEELDGKPVWMNVCVEGGAGVGVKGLNKNSDNYIRGCCLFYFYHK